MHSEIGSKELQHLPNIVAGDIEGLLDFGTGSKWPAKAQAMGIAIVVEFQDDTLHNLWRWLIRCAHHYSRLTISRASGS